LSLTAATSKTQRDHLHLITYPSELEIDNTKDISRFASMYFHVIWNKWENWFFNLWQTSWFQFVPC